MLFNSLNNLKRSMIMMIICLSFAGLTMFVVPTSYIPALGKILGFFFLVLSILKILDFVSSKKAMINYIGLTLGLLATLPLFGQRSQVLLETTEGNILLELYDDTLSRLPGVLRLNSTIVMKDVIPGRGLPL